MCSDQLMYRPTLKSVSQLIFHSNLLEMENRNFLPSMKNCVRSYFKYDNVRPCRYYIKQCHKHYGERGEDSGGEYRKVISNTRINILIAFIKVRKFKLIKKASKIKQNEKWTKLGFAKFSLWPAKCTSFLLTVLRSGHMGSFSSRSFI